MELTYRDLMNGSYNHLRAFVSTLDCHGPSIYSRMTSKRSYPGGGRRGRRPRRPAAGRERLRS